MRKIVVYTCVTGAYDAPKRPSALPAGADYVCFTPDAESCPPGAPEGMDLDDQMLSRWYKLNPHLLFPDYEYSLWIDGNIDLLGGELFATIEEQTARGVLYSGIRHPERDDVYAESYKILANGRDVARRLRRTVRFLRSEGFPRHAGLMENNVILRRHNDPAVVSFDELWWSLMLRYSHRDQMTQGYCLRKCGIEPSYLIPEGFSARNHPSFAYTGHGPVYVKDRSLRGLARDGMTVLRKFFYRLFLRCHSLSSR